MEMNVFKYQFNFFSQKVVSQVEGQALNAKTNSFLILTYFMWIIRENCNFNNI